MKKRLILSVFVLVLLFSISFISGKIFSADDYALGKREIARYINFKGLNLKEGTPEYFDFLNDLLWGEYNKDLQNSPYFGKILKYAAYYYSHPEILYPEQCKDCLGDVVTNYNTQSTTWVYNPSQAVNYAHQYSTQGGYGQNSNFPDFRNRGGDCTNFASQVVNAGNVPIDGSGTCSNYPTFTKWYVNRAQWWCVQSRWAWSNSWSVVGDFYTYHSQYKNNANSTVFSLSQTNSLRSSAVLGDIVQLETGGSKWHSLIVTDKRNGEIYFTYHSGRGGYDYVDYPLHDIIENNSNNGHCNIDHFFLLHFH